MKQSVKRMVGTILSLIFIVASIVGFFNFVMPLYREIGVSKSEAAGRAQLLENQKRIVAQVESLVSTYQEGRKLQDIVSSALPLDQEVSQALLQIGGIAQSNNMIPTAFVVTPPAQNVATLRAEARKTSLLKEVSSITIRVDLTGSYEDFKSFIKNLETNIRIFDIKAMTLQPIGKPGQNIYSFNVTVVTYYQNP